MTAKKATEQHILSSLTRNEQRSDDFQNAIAALNAMVADLSARLDVLEAQQARRQIREAVRY